ncbi:uncharacterized [Tachysurus ichikawai]
MPRANYALRGTQRDAAASSSSAAAAALSSSSSSSSSSTASSSSAAAAAERAAGAHPPTSSVARVFAPPLQQKEDAGVRDEARDGRAGPEPRPASFSRS